MKNFSISFSLSKEDYKNFYKTVNKAVMPQKLKLSAIALVVASGLAIMKFYSLAVTSLCLMFIFFFLGEFVNTLYVVRMNNKSKIGRRITTVDFYSDHFEILYLPDENFKGKSERHYPLSSVKMVLQNSGYIYFKLEDYTTLIIPRRDINPENAEKIKNMIDNLYPDRFLEE